MSDISYYESRSGKLTCSASELFSFVTDIRNFGQFIPDGTITDWHAEKESCNFNVSMLGTVSFRLVEKEKYSKIVFNGDALKKNDFTLVLHITDNNNNPAEVKVTLNAELNPMLKMMAANPIIQFLEMLVSQMESFDGWNNVRI
jgi:hypothetical protein